MALLGKKAQGVLPDIIFVMIQLVLIIIIFGTLFLFINQYLDETSYEKKYVAMDIAMLIDVLHLKGNIFTTYLYDKDDLTVDFDKNKVIVYETAEDKVSYPFTPSIKLWLEKSKTNQGIKFFKTEDELVVGNNVKPNLKYISCPKLNIKIKQYNLVIDATHARTKNDYGYVNGNIKEKDVTGAIGLALYHHYPNAFFTRTNLVGPIEEQIAKPKEEIKKAFEESNVIIIIQTGNATIEKNFIVYYSKNVKSEKLACLIANSLSSKLDVNTVIVPNNELDSNKTIVVLHIENIIFGATYATEIANAIADAIKEYG